MDATTISALELRILVRLQDTQSFTATAEALHLDKSRVSRVVAQVERRLGVQLFERSTRALRVTELGTEICARARGILAGLEAIGDLAANRRKAPSGTLRISCGTEFGMLAVSGWISSFLQRYSAVSVEADFSNRLVDVIEDGFDVAIRLGDVIPENLPLVKLGTLSYGLYASPSLIARGVSLERPSEIPADLMLRYSSGRSGSRWRLEKAGEVVTLNPRGKVVLNNVFALADSVRAGLGIARLPRLLAREAVACKELVEILHTWHLPPVPIHAVLPPNRLRLPITRAFLEIARESLADAPAV